MLGVETIGRNVFCKRHRHPHVYTAEGVEGSQKARPRLSIAQFHRAHREIAAMEKAAAAPSTI